MRTAVNFHPRWTFHVTPTSASWINVVEGVLRQAHQAAPQARRVPLPGLAPGSHQPLVTEASPEPTPFLWTKDPDTIIAAAKRGHQALDSLRQPVAAVGSGVIRCPDGTVPVPFAAVWRPWSAGKERE